MKGGGGDFCRPSFTFFEHGGRRCRWPGARYLFRLVNKDRLSMKSVLRVGRNRRHAATKFVVSSDSQWIPSSGFEVYSGLLQIANYVC